MVMLVVAQVNSWARVANPMPLRSIFLNLLQAAEDFVTFDAEIAVFDGEIPL